MHDNLSKVIEVDINDILPNRFQPRIQFDENEILELSDSIKEHGIIQPLVVRPVGEKYEIIAGERRYKASVLAGKENVPVIVKNLTDKESAEIALIENIQRKNLTPIEEALSYKKILDMGYTTQESLAVKLGKSQPAVANKIRLLNLSDDVQEALLENRISERHARSLLKLKTSKEQNDMLNRIINERLTVRRTDEEIVKVLNSENNESDTEQKIIEKGEMNMNNQNFNFDIFGTNTQSQVPVEPTVQPTPVVEPQVNVQAPSFIQSDVPTLEPQQPAAPVFEAFSQPTPIMPEPTPSVEPQINAQAPQFIPQSQTPVEPVQDPAPSFDIFAPTTISMEPEVTKSEPVVQPQSFDIFNTNSEVQQTNFTAPVTAPIVEQPQTEVVQQNENTFGFGPIAPESSPVVEQIPVVQPAAPAAIEPIIVTDYTKQYDPVMPQNTIDVTPTVDFKEVIKAIRECQQKIESYGYRMDLEEYDLENLYQAVFKIDKK